MSSSENEPRRLRGDSDNQQRTAQAPRHFKDDKTRQRKATAEEAVTEEPAEVEEAAAEEQPSQQTASASDGQASSSSAHHHHHHHHHHSGSSHSSRSSRSAGVFDAIWEGEEIGGEKGWTATAYSNAKKTASTDKDPEFVHPVEQEDRPKPEQMKTEKKPEAETSFDYVVPKQSFQQQQRHPGKFSTHSGKTKTASQEEIEEAEEGFVFRSLSEADKNRRKRRRHHHHHHHHHHSSSSSGAASSSSGSSDSTSGSSSESTGKKRRHHHHHHHMRRWQKIVIIVLCVLLGLAAALVGTYFILREIGRHSMHNYNNIAIVSPTEEESGEEVIEVVDNGRTIVYEGKTYRFNEDVVCIAVIGINYNYEERSLQSMGDAINMIAFDTETGQLTVIGVSRDTMTDVRIYSEAGAYIDTELTQITYAYSFDNKKISGGENTSASLSKLFYGLPVNHYFAINLDALISLNDAIGGVTLTSSMDFSSPVRDITAGETVTLHGKEVEYYVRYRDDDAEGNNVRMQRQQEYIRAFLSQVIPAAKKDLSLVTDLYNIIRANSDSNLDLAKIVYLASELTSKMSSTDDISYLSVQGEAKEGKEHAEFYPDDKNVLETLVKVFYQPVE